jgi:protein DEK
LRAFCGFAFDKESTEYNKKHEMLSKQVVAGLKGICEVLDLERSGTKEDLIERILEFLLEPKATKVKSGKPRTATKARSQSNEEINDNTETEEEDEEEKKEEEKEEEEEEKEKEDEEEEEEEEEEEKKPKGRGKRAAPAPKKAAPVTPAKKKKEEPAQKPGSKNSYDY